MTNRYASANTATAELAADYDDCRDKEVMQALVTAGALVALADGHLEDVERDELVGFIHRQDFAPTISQRGIAKAFDNRVRELQENYNPNVVIEALRPLAGLSLTSVVVRTAERVAAADRKIHPSEEKAMSLIRLIMMSLPANKSLAVLSLSVTRATRALSPDPDPRPGVSSMKVEECDVEPPAAGRPMKLPNDVIVGRNQIQRWGR
jgi:tellurite resistance protein